MELLLWHLQLQPAEQRNSDQIREMVGSVEPVEQVAVAAVAAAVVVVVEAAADLLAFADLLERGLEGRRVYRLGRSVAAGTRIAGRSCGRCDYRATSLSLVPAFLPGR